MVSVVYVVSVASEVCGYGVRGVCIVSKCFTVSEVVAWCQRCGGVTELREASRSGGGPTR